MSGELKVLGKGSIGDIADVDVGIDELMMELVVIRTCPGICSNIIVDLSSRLPNNLNEVPLFSPDPPTLNVLSRFDICIYNSLARSTRARH